MKRLTDVVAMLMVFSTPALPQQRWAPPDPALLAHAKALLEQVPFVDGHNDLLDYVQEHLASDLSRIDLSKPQPDLPADIPRLREGRVGVQFWSAYVSSDSMRTGGALRQALRSIDQAQQLIERYPDFEFARTADEIERIHRTGKVASLIGFEGGHGIDNTLAAVRLFYRLGVRYLTLTHFATTDWADAATDYPRHHGLTDFGRQVVREMNRVGMFADLSHVSAETMRDAIRVSQAPVIFSHSGAQAINSNPRNVPDDVLAMLAKNRGVIMVDFIAEYTPPNGPAWAAKRDSALAQLHAQLVDDAEITRRLADWERQNPKPRGTVADVADHIDHIRRVAGIDHIGIGSDFYTNAPDAMAVGLEDPSKFPNLFAELLRRGYGDEDLRKIAGLNFLRAMREMEQVAARLQAQGGRLKSED